MNSKSSKNSILKWRVYLVLVSFLVVIIIVIVQLYRVQIVQGESYSIRSDNQNSISTTKIFDRGQIYFTDKNNRHTSAAGLQTGYKVTAQTSIIKNPEDIFNNLNFYLDLDEEKFSDQFHKANGREIEVKNRVDPEIADDIKKLNIKGLFLSKENWRFYPGNDLASQTIGFMAFGDDGELSGRYGLERNYENVLKVKEQDIFTNFFAELLSDSKDKIVKRRDNLKVSLITTIDPEIQTFVQKEIGDIAESWQSKEIGVIVMNPNNGEIYSMGLYPTFDLNEFRSVANVNFFKNSLVENVYEMGSIIKPLTLAVGLDTNSVTPSTTYNDLGSVSMNGFTISNYDKKGRGLVDMQQVLNKSLNTGVAFVVSKIGNETFADYFKKIFGSRTDIDLPNEAAPLVANLNTNRNIEFVTASYGQGIAISPISTIRALASLGNGGKLVWPHLVREIEYQNGSSHKINNPEPIQIFSPETSEEISRMLVNVVDNALRDGTVALEKYSIAAKTGTAQIPSPQGGYYEDKYLHSFFGYFPAYDPKFIIFLYQIEPQGARYASETLTEPFMNIVKFLINYYQIEPDRQSKDD